MDSWYQYFEYKVKEVLIISKSSFGSFYGDDVTEAEKDTSCKLVEANAVNLNGTVGSVRFLDKPENCREVPV